MRKKTGFLRCWNGDDIPRNRELMRIFKDVGLVEQLGSGMSRILKVYDKDIFHISDHFIKVVFPFSVTGSHRGIDNGIDEYWWWIEIESICNVIMSMLPKATGGGDYFSEKYWNQIKNQI